MRLVLVAPVLLLLAACGQAAPTTDTAVTSIDTPADTSMSMATATAMPLNNAQDYDSYDPPTAPSTDDYNQRAQQPGTRSCPELWAAAISDDVNSIQNILISGVSIDCLDDSHGGAPQTALMAAASGAAVDATHYLVDHGAQVNLQDSSGRTALGYAQDTQRQMSASGQLAEVVQRLNVIIAYLQGKGVTN